MFEMLLYHYFRFMLIFHADIIFIDGLYLSMVRYLLAITKESASS